MHNTINRTNIIIFWAIFAFVTASFAFIFLNFPMTYDDWWYWGKLNDTGVDENGHHTLWLGIKDTMNFQWYFDNTRISNYIGILMLLLPRWIPMSIVSICFAIGLWLMTRVSDIRAGQVGKLVLLCLLLVFTIMWQEGMFCQMYAFNYICVMPVFFGGIYLFIRERETKLFWMFLLGLLLGMCHESYAITGLIGLSIILILKVKKATKGRVALLAGLVLGLLWLIIPPAMAYKSSLIDGAHIKTSRLVYLSVTVLFEVIWIVSLFFKRSRQLALSPLPLLTAVSIPILTYMVYVSTHVRAAFPGFLLCACCLVIYFSFWWPKTFNDKTYVSLIFCFSGIIILVVHLTAVCIETVRIRPIIENATNQYVIHHDSDGAVYADMRYPWETSMLTLGRPDINFANPREWHFKFMHFVIGNDRPMAVPPILKNYKSDEGEMLGGDSYVRLWNNYLVSSNLADSAETWAKIRYGKIEGVSPLNTVVFENYDGEKFVYIVPDRPVYCIYAGEPKSLTFNVFK